MSEELFKTLIHSIYTVDNFHSVLGILKQFFDHHFFEKHKKTTLQKAFREFIEVSEEAKRMGGFPELPADFLKSFTMENRNTILTEIEERLNKIPRMVMYVPVLFTKEEVRQMSEWVRRNVYEETLLEMKVDRLSVGGCNFVWNGVYYDYSIQYFIEKKRNDIRDMVRSIKK